MHAWLNSRWPSSRIILNYSFSNFQKTDFRSGGTWRRAVIESQLVKASLNVKLSAELPAIIRTIIIQMTQRQPITQSIRGHEQRKIKYKGTTVLVKQTNIFYPEVRYGNTKPKTYFLKAYRIMHVCTETKLKLIRCFLNSI